MDKKTMDRRRFELAKAALPSCALACGKLNGGEIARTAVMLGDETLRILTEEPFETREQLRANDERLRDGGK